MLRLALFLLLVVVVHNGAIAQQPSDFSLMQDDTTLREKYRAVSEQLFQQRMKELPEKWKSDYKKVYERQYEELEGLWTGNRVITAPEMNDYLQQVLKKILQTNTDISNSQLRVVITRDWWPNAYSLGDGSLAINAGLLVFLENEAQLAFVLCHELAHFQLAHTSRSIREYVETINSESYQAELKRLSKETYRVNEQLEKLAKKFVFHTRRHRRDHEAEADRQALQWLQKTGYDLHAIRTSLQLLDRIDDSLWYQPPALSTVFSFPDYPFRPRWVQAESRIFGQLNKEQQEEELPADSLKTHPDCSQRIGLLKAEIDAAPAGQLFLVDEPFFQQRKKMLLPEIIEFCYQDDQLSRNLFYSLLLLQDTSLQSYAAFSVVRCLNRLYEKQEAHQVGTSTDQPSADYSEAYNQVLRFIQRVRLSELAQVSFHFSKKYRDWVMAHPSFTRAAKLAEQRARQEP